MLTDKDRYYFNTFGYTKIKKVFSKNEISKLNNEFNKIYKNYFQESMFKIISKAILKEETKMLPCFTDNSDFIQNIFFNKGLFRAIPEKLLSHGYRYWGSDASLFAYGTAWHRDTATKAKNIKINIYLNSGSKNFGAFRLIPGSHHIGDKYTNFLGKACSWPNSNYKGGFSETDLFPENYSPSENLFFKRNIKKILNRNQSKIDLPHQFVEFEEGDIIIFDNRLIHSIFAPRIPKIRKLITLIFVEYPEKKISQSDKEICEELKFLKQHECNQYSVNCYTDKIIKFLKSNNLDNIINEFENIKPKMNLNYSGKHAEQYPDLKKFLTKNYF